MSLAQQLESLIQDGGMPPERGMSRSGLTLARITNVNDPDKLNRVKCLPVGVPEAEETDWCYFMAPMGGKERGVYFPPQVDDLVVLAYLDDDPHRPVMLGAIWNTETTPPFTIQDGKVEDFAIRTPQKIDLVLHDEKDKQTVTLTMPSGAVLQLNDEAQSATLKDKNGDNALLMNFKDGEIELKAKTKLTLSAGDTKITLESSGNMTLERGKNMTLKAGAKLAAEAPTIEEKASGQMNLKGAAVQIKSDGTMDVSATGPATLKGAIVKIN